MHARIGGFAAIGSTNGVELVDERELTEVEEWIESGLNGPMSG